MSEIINGSHKGERKTRREQLIASLEELPHVINEAAILGLLAYKTALDLDENQIGAMPGKMSSEPVDANKLITEMAQAGLIQRIPGKNAWVNPYGSELSKKNNTTD